MVKMSIEIDTGDAEIDDGEFDRNCPKEMLMHWKCIKWTGCLFKINLKSIINLSDFNRFAVIDFDTIDADFIFKICYVH